MEEERKKFNFSSNILGGQFLLNLGVTKRWFFALYIFILIII